MNLGLSDSKSKVCNGGTDALPHNAVLQQWADTKERMQNFLGDQMGFICSFFPLFIHSFIHPTRVWCQLLCWPLESNEDQYRRVCPQRAHGGSAELDFSHTQTCKGVDSHDEGNKGQGTVPVWDLTYAKDSLS